MVSLVKVSMALRFVCAEFSTCPLSRFQLDVSFFSLQKSSVASGRAFLRPCVSSESSLPEPQLLSRLGSRGLFTDHSHNTLSHVPDVPPILS